MMEPANSRSALLLRIRSEIIIFALAFMVRLIILAADGDRLWKPQGAEAFNIARSLALHGEFANAYGPETGPTAHTTPIYPFIMAIFLVLGGDGPTGYGAIRVFNALASALNCSLQPTVARVFGFSRRAGLWSGFLSAILPYGRLETEGAFEAVLSLTCLYAIVIFADKVLSSADGLKPVLFGTVLGLGILTSASILPAAVAIVLWYLIPTAKQKCRRLSMLCLLGAMLVMVPWWIRNYLRFGEFIPLRSNFWLEVAVSNQDGAYPTLEQNISRGVFQKSHPYSNGRERRLVEDLGEVRYMRTKREVSIEWIQEHKMTFVKLVLQRLASIIAFPHKALVLALLSLFVAVAGLAGLFLFVDTEGNVIHKRLKFVVILLCSIGVHFAVQVSWRYRYPIHMLLWIPAASMLLGVREKFWSACGFGKSWRTESVRAPKL